MCGIPVIINFPNAFNWARGGEENTIFKLCPLGKHTVYSCVNIMDNLYALLVQNPNIQMSSCVKKQQKSLRNEHLLRGRYYTKMIYLMTSFYPHDNCMTLVLLPLFCWWKRFKYSNAISRQVGIWTQVSVSKANILSFHKHTASENSSHNKTQETTMNEGTGYVPLFHLSEQDKLGSSFHYTYSLWSSVSQLREINKTQNHF